jgi:hypothetical protein
MLHTTFYDKKFILLSFFIILLLLLPGFPRNLENTQVLKCLVLESSTLIHQEDGSSLQYLIIRHLEEKDRLLFSQWLHSTSGKSIQFIYNKKLLTAHIGRLKMCFGRGLLLVRTETLIPPHATIYIKTTGTTEDTEKDRKTEGREDKGSGEPNRLYRP